jgi:2-methylisocitrate lyase-like PEP mutase family enzyme
MSIATQAEKAERLRQLHLGPRILVLPNAWDVVSARIMEEAGFPVVATSSAAIANVLGYPDGQRISREEMLEMVARIARGVRVPVTADMESGYGLTPEDMAETAREVVDAGAVGMNLEDVTGDDESSQVEMGLQVEKIRAICEASAAAGVPLVVNARTDVYLIPIGDESTRFERTVERLRAYRAAGAGCVFAPGVRDKETITRLVRAIDAPLNVLAQPGSPTAGELEAMGVARVSLGSGAMRAALGTVRRVARELMEHGTFSALGEGAIPFGEVNGLLRGDVR